MVSPTPSNNKDEAQRALVAARNAITEAHNDQARAIDQARAAKYPWTYIAADLNLSEKTCRTIHRRYLQSREGGEQA